MVPLDTTGWSPEPEPLVDAPKMADLVDRVMVFVNPGRKVVWQEAVPERDLKERSYVSCEAVLIFRHDGTYERHDDYRVWQSTVYRHLAAPIRVFRIRREGQAYSVESVARHKNIMEAVAQAVENEGLQPERGRRPMRAPAPQGGPARSYDEAKRVMDGEDDDDGGF